MPKRRDEPGMRSRLMKAAMTAFMKKSFSRCTMNDVAEEANVAKGTSYLYFSSKEQLMMAMYEHYAMQTLEFQKGLIAKAKDLNAKDLLSKACKNLLGDALKHRQTFGLWFQFLSLGSSLKFGDTIRKIVANNYRGHDAFLETILDQGIQSGEFRVDINKRAVAASLTSLLEGFMVRDYADPDILQFENDYTTITTLILESICIRDERQK
jgi:TetR/AcrR family transcriptional regulator, fatty acid metabolism regulator protein